MDPTAAKDALKAQCRSFSGRYVLHIRLLLSEGGPEGSIASLGKERHQR